MPRLIISTAAGGDPQRTVDLGAEAVTIGRDATNTVPLETEGKASRRHCQVVPVEGGYEVVDNQSTNGTRVNGGAIQRRRLHHGDVIEVGLTKLRFEDERAVASGAASACYLEWTAGDRKGERIPLTAARTSFGRRDSNTVVLADKMASSHHAEIVKDLNGYTVRDLGSTNGTLVNGTPVTETMLTHGARVRIGGAKFVFKDPAMKDVEVALEGLEEDDGGWGMMSELDLSRAGGGGAMGAVAAVLLLVALGAGAFFLGGPTQDPTAVVADTENLLSDGGFDGEEGLLWTVDEGSPAAATRSTAGGRAGRGGYLAVRHDGVGSGRGVARSLDELDLAPGQAYRFSGYVARGGEGRAFVGMQWARGASATTGATAVTQTVPIGEATGSAWTRVEAMVRRPAWARVGRPVVVVEPGASIRVDDLRLEAVAQAPALPDLPAARGVDWAVSPSGSLSARRTATVLFVGAAPCATMPDGRRVGGADGFAAETVAATGDGAVECRGTLRGAGEPVPARVVWRATAEGMSVEVAVDGAAEVGLCADVPRAHVEGGLGVLAATGASKVSPEPGAQVDGVRRVLLGDPRPVAEVSRPPTLIALDVEGEANARMSTREATDAGLARIGLAVAGASGAFRVVANFDSERARAKADLDRALSLAQGTPGAGLVELEAVAQRYPFDDGVVGRAREAAQGLSAKADEDVRALDAAVERFVVFGDGASLADAERRAADLVARFPSSAAATPREQYIHQKAADLKALRERHALARAATDVARLVRLADLLEQETTVGEGGPDMKAVALAYYDAVVARYGALEHAVPAGEEEAATVRRIQQARERRDALLGDPSVAARFPN